QVAHAHLVEVGKGEHPGDLRFAQILADGVDLVAEVAGGLLHAEDQTRDVHLLEPSHSRLRFSRAGLRATRRCARPRGGRAAASARGACAPAPPPRDPNATVLPWPGAFWRACAPPRAGARRCLWPA